MDDKPSLKGEWLCNVTHFKCGGSIHTSGIVEVGVVKFYTEGDLSSLAKG